MKKYEFTGEVMVKFGVEFKQIKALITFGSIVEGSVGGWIEKEENLDQSGNAWVSGDARVSGNAWVYGNAEVLWLSKVGSRLGTTTVFKTKTGIGVSCGCFYGDLAEFEKAVEETHGNTKSGKEYKAFVMMVKAHFELEV